MDLNSKTFSCLLLVLFLFVVRVTFAHGHDKEGDDEDLFKFLINANIGLSFSINQFDYEYHHKVRNTYLFDISKASQQISSPTSKWDVRIAKATYDERQKIYKLIITAEILEGEVDNASIALEFKLNNWKEGDYLLMPAAAYNGNRFESRRIAYSPKLLDPKDIGPDKGIIISDVPRLNIRSGPSQISLRSGDLAAPYIGIHHHEPKTGFSLQFNPQNEIGDLGVLFQENRNRDEALLKITSPVVREGERYFITDNEFNSEDKPHDFQMGDRITFEINLSAYSSENIQAVFDKFFDYRHADFMDSSLPSVHPFSSVFDVQESKFNEQNFVEEYGYYSVGMRESYTQDWAIGWTGGMISTYPLYFAGGEGTKKNVIRNFNWLFADGITPSGFFWESGEKGTIRYGGDQRKFHTKNWHIIRRSADALFFILKQFYHFKSMNVSVEKKWEDGIRTVADAFVKLWDDHGQMGQFVNSLSGDIEVGGSTSAAIAPAALIYAYLYYGDENYLRVAIASADHFYENYIRAGITCGGPADAMQNPDSESSYSMLESFVVLYEHTKDPIWLQRSKEMAHQFSTWVMPYNYTFPQNSLFGQMDFKTVGTVWANTQNKHSAPGICTHSGSALLRLYRHSGDIRYARLLQEITRAIPQYISHPDKPIGEMKIGWISERVNTTDWLEGIGEMMYMSTWAETAMMLTKLEVPGLFIDIEKATCIAFDNIDSEILSGDKNKMIIELSNPTGQDAELTYFIEGGNGFDSYFGNLNKVSAPTIKIKAGETKRIAVDKRKKRIISN